MNIGTVIRTYRKEKNMTQEEMANRLGVTAPAVNKMGERQLLSRHHIACTHRQIAEHFTGYSAFLSGGVD